MLSATFYWKEGAPTWVGTAVFSSKKETLKHFRLEVRPFLGIALSVCFAASSPEGGKDGVCAMPRPLLPGEVSPKVTERLYKETLRTVSYTHLRAHETDSYLVCRLLLEKKKK